MTPTKRRHLSTSRCGVCGTRCDPACLANAPWWAYVLPILILAAVTAWVILTPAPGAGWEALP